jgi:2-polyprenyl-3-methyl-5-hydroxy-6-metoxy-1,4-benzoquinol methylase
MSTPKQVFDSLWKEKLAAGGCERHVIGNNARVDAAALALKPGRRLLDVGCGTGSLNLAIRGKFDEVHGIDFAEEAIAVASRNGMIARRLDLNVECLPFQARFFDAITMLAVLPYVYDPQHVLKECYRVLRPSGQLLVAAANMRTVGKLFRLCFLGRFPSTSKGARAGCDGGAMHYFCSRDLRILLSDAGFDVVRAKGVYYRPESLGGTLASLPLLAGPLREFFAGEVLLGAERRHNEETLF